MSGRPPPPVSSPCVGVCRIEPQTGLCLGCARTIEEIAAWGAMGEGDRAMVTARLKRRKSSGAKDLADNFHNDGKRPTGKA